MPNPLPPRRTPARSASSPGAPGPSAAPTPAQRFLRTRAAHRDELAQDYAEAIAHLAMQQGRARVIDLARTMGVSHVTVTRALARMHARGLVDARPRQPVTLTAAGQRLAREATLRHEAVLAFLLSIGVPRAQAELDSEGIEHHVSETTIAAMKKAMKPAGTATAGRRPRPRAPRSA